MGLIVILAVIGALALGSWLLYRRPRSIRPGALPDASLHVKDDVPDERAAADMMRQLSARGSWPWG